MWPLTPPASPFPTSHCPEQQEAGGRGSQGKTHSGTKYKSRYLNPFFLERMIVGWDTTWMWLWQRHHEAITGHCTPGAESRKQMVTELPKCIIINVNCVGHAVVLAWTRVNRCFHPSIHHMSIAFTSLVADTKPKIVGTTFLLDGTIAIDSHW